MASVVNVCLQEQSHLSFIPHHPGVHQKDVGGGGRAGLLSRPRHESRSRPAWDMCHLRRLREFGMAPKVDCGQARTKEIDRCRRRSMRWRFSQRARFYSMPSLAGHALAQPRPVSSHAVAEDDG